MYVWFKYGRQLVLSLVLICCCQLASKAEDTDDLENRIHLEIVTPSTDTIVHEALDSTDIVLRVTFDDGAGKRVPGVSLFDCQAVAEDGKHQTQLTDSRGCSAQHSPMGCMVEQNGTVRSPTFKLFSLAETGEVNITCSWETCIIPHHPKCADRCSFFHHRHGRGHMKMGRRRGSGENEAEVEMETRRGADENEAGVGMETRQGSGENEAEVETETRRGADENEAGVGMETRRGTGENEAGMQWRLKREKNENRRHHISTTIRVMPSHGVRRGHHHDPSAGHHGHDGGRSLESFTSYGNGPRGLVVADSSPLLYLNPITCSVLLIILTVFLALFVTFLRSLRRSVQDIKREVEVQRSRDKFLVP